MVSKNTMLALIAAVVLLAFFPLVGPRYLVDLATQIMIYALFALSLNILVGYLGNISFGHAAFFAIGGYGCAYLTTTLGWPLIFSMAAAVALTAAISLIIGYFCVRLNEIYFAMLTLAFSMLVWSIAIKWRPVTGGDDGFVGVTVPEILQDPTHFYWFTMIVFVASATVLWIIVNSTMGRVFVAIRENETRASFLGVDVKKIRLAGFMIAGTFAGVAGCLLALYTRGMFPESAFWTSSGQVLIMALLGGIHAFLGPVLGAAALYTLELVINQYTQYWQIVLGLILLAIVMLAPEGLSGVIADIRKKFIRSAGHDS